MPNLLTRAARWLMIMLGGIVGCQALLAPTRLLAAELTGEQIYTQQCADCHGKSGEGVAQHYATPLAGDRSIVELTRLIEKTMPEGEPEKCVGDDAKKVATYIYDTFYGPIAQARLRPARIELSRLTVRQLQNSVADILGGFRPSGNWGDERGLKGEYYKSRRMRSSDAAIKRVDPRVDFQFGEESPDPSIEKNEFTIAWEGSVFAPETGEYEFMARTHNGARLFINDSRKPLIDAWVKSGSDTDHHEPIKLLGGRAYYLRLELLKSKDDKEKRASMTLLWKRPGRSLEVITPQFLSTQWQPTRFVLNTPFPPDDRSIGYERGTAISKEWDQASTDAAIEVAAYVRDNLNELAGTRGDAGDRAEKVKRFCTKFVERAFRRPIDDDLRKLYIDRHLEEGSDLDLAVQKVVLLVMKSPRFLYRDLDGNDDPYATAERLAFYLWDTVPDEQLLKDAAEGRLSNREQIEAAANRMVSDLKCRAKVREFFRNWLRMDHLTDLAKDRELFPEFNDEVVTDLRSSLEMFVDDVVWSDSSDARQLLLADYIYLNGRLSKLYGGDLAENADFQKVTLQSQPRAGALTHPFLLSGFAYTATSSPIHRGVFIARSVLGRSLRPPPEAVSPLAAELHADLTTRERINLQTSSESCQSCHAMINPLGFTLENYDAIGRYRTEEKGKPIDTTGGYLTRTGESREFRNVKELADFLAASEETHGAMVEQMFHHLVKQPARAYGEDTLPHLRASFAADGYSIRKLLVRTASFAAEPRPAAMAAK